MYLYNYRKLYGMIRGKENSMEQHHPTKPRIAKDLILLFAVPLAIIAIVAAVVYVPRLFAHPKYSFVYSTCADYNCYGRYTVSSGSIIATKQGYASWNDQLPTLSYYDAATNASHTISLASAQKLHLDNASKSPDGYSVVQASNDSGFLFWSSSSDDGWYLENGLKKKLLQLPSNTTQVTFLGWVEK